MMCQIRLIMKGRCVDGLQKWRMKGWECKNHRKRGETQTNPGVLDYVDG